MKKIIFLICLIICEAPASYSQKTARPPDKAKDAQPPAIVPLTDAKTKEITAELSCSPDARVFLENILRPIEIRTGNDKKIRLVTTITYKGNPSYSDEEWLEELDISIKGQEQSIVVKSGRQIKREGKSQPLSEGRNHASKLNAGGEIAIIDSSGKWINRKANVFRTITLFIPPKATLDINSKYADIEITGNLDELIANISNGDVKMKNVNNIRLTVSYVKIRAADIQTALMNLSNSDIRATKIGKLDITSTNSGIDLGIVNMMLINSINDKYEIQQLGGLSGEKKYGQLEITNLKDSLNIMGVNADIKIRSIAPGANMIKVDNKYGELRLPVRTLKNYRIKLQGANTNISAPFKLKENSDQTKTAEAGPPNGSFTEFRLKCDDCKVDFN